MKYQTSEFKKGALSLVGKGFENDPGVNPKEMLKVNQEVALELRLESSARKDASCSSGHGRSS